MYPYSLQRELDTLSVTTDDRLNSRRNCYNSGMKTIIWIGITIGGTVGSWLGAIPDGGNWLGGWSILGSLIGSILGLWAAYKIGHYYI
jgi:hypothetical protein